MIELERPLNLFFVHDHSSSDRWVSYDRYPRWLVRRGLDAIGIQKRSRPSGHEIVCKNLRKGLDRLGVEYRYNNFRYIRRNPDDLMCILGQPKILIDYDWPNPVVFGPCIFDHPLSNLEFWEQNPNVRRMLLPGHWTQDMFERWYPGSRLEAWPVGIDVDKWKPCKYTAEKPKRVLIYDKESPWREQYSKYLIPRIRSHIEKRNIKIETIVYGKYTPKDLRAALKRSQAVILLARHETQGIAYQQMLASGVPILAWNPEYYWQGYGECYGPVPSVPYWDKRCGMKFRNIGEFYANFDSFWGMVQSEEFSPREYVTEELTLKKRSEKYVEIVVGGLSKARSNR